MYMYLNVMFVCLCFCIKHGFIVHICCAHNHKSLLNVVFSLLVKCIHDYGEHQASKIFSFFALASDFIMLNNLYLVYISLNYLFCHDRVLLY